MKDLIERMRAKPEHERRRITLLSSIGATALVALVWVTATVSSGSLAIKSDGGGTNLSGMDSASNDNPLANSQKGFSQLLGAVSAFQSGSSTQAGLRIEDAPSETPAPTGPDTRTVIPF